MPSGTCKGEKLTPCSAKQRLGASREVGGLPAASPGRLLNPIVSSTESSNQHPPAFSASSILTDAFLAPMTSPGTSSLSRFTGFSALSIDGGGDDVEEATERLKRNWDNANDDAVPLCDDTGFSFPGLANIFPDGLIKDGRDVNTDWVLLLSSCLLVCLPHRLFFFLLSSPPIFNVISLSVSVYHRSLSLVSLASCSLGRSQHVRYRG